MKIFYKIAFIVILLVFEAVSLLKGEDCMVGMTCGNQMMWRKVPTCEQDEAEEMKIKSLEDRVMNLSVVLTQLENKLQQSLDVSTVPAAIQATTMNQDLEISTGTFL
uniref:uncharacterized protein LOC120329203 n=1 Tax=Styela clava TaxID=7725 RepID=UPI001939C91C|nr:uncharacterized protein LOC120329203 [Styela clava]